MIDYEEALRRLAAREDLSPDVVEDIGTIALACRQAAAEVADMHLRLNEATPWVSPLIAAVVKACGVAGPTAPAQVRRLRAERDELQKQLDSLRVGTQRLIDAVDADDRRQTT